ncbi:hypothetical protein [Tunturiibacter gelidiferens]|uniref:hypothetical protein n=1 Tax=Tunturiibacter gelidiferens TaxID=3069689 RepID=UPI003D9AC4B4
MTTKKTRQLQEKRDKGNCRRRETKATAGEERQRQLQKRNAGVSPRAVHDEAVNSFGRDDVLYYWLGKRTKMTANPFGMTTKKTKATAKEQR